MSLLLASGHPTAALYPIAVVWSEARIVRQRQAFRLKREMILMQQVVSSIFDAKAGKNFKRTLNRLDECD